MPEVIETAAPLINARELGTYGVAEGLAFMDSATVSNDMSGNASIFQIVAIAV
jgi:hypothetical protein